MQRFDERLKELGSLFCNGNYLSGAKKHGKLGKVRVNYPCTRKLPMRNIQSTDMLYSANILYIFTGTASLWGSECSYSSSARRYGRFTLFQLGR